MLGAMASTIDDILAESKQDAPAEGKHDQKVPTWSIGKGFLALMVTGWTVGLTVNWLWKRKNLTDAELLMLSAKGVLVQKPGAKAPQGRGAGWDDSTVGRDIAVSVLGHERWSDLRNDGWGFYAQDPKVVA